MKAALERGAQHGIEQHACDSYHNARREQRRAATRRGTGERGHEGARERAGRPQQ